MATRKAGTEYVTTHTTPITTTDDRAMPWMTRGSTSSITLISRLKRLRRRPVGVASNHCSGYRSSEENRLSW